MNSLAKSDLPIQHQLKEKNVITISKKHHIFALITRIGFFKTETSIKLTSISKVGITVNAMRSKLTDAINKKLLIELYVDGKLFIHKAYIVSYDIINELYHIKFTHSFEFIDEYVEHLNTLPRYGLNAPPASDGTMNLKAIT